MVRTANEKTPTFYAGCMAWCIASAILIRNDLGVIAFVGSILGVIWVFGLRDKFKSETENSNSAYSVFNRGGKAILGGLTGEQVDQQMRGGFATNSSSSGKMQNSKLDDAPLTTTESKSTKSGNITQQEKLKRRSAAAAAAERRVQEQQQKQQQEKN